MDVYSPYSRDGRDFVETQIGRWGNSLAVRIPQALAREAQLEDGTPVELSVSDGSLILVPNRRRYSLEQLVRGITAENRHAETDWGQAVGNEVW
jgi:antitoxin MazE